MMIAFINHIVKTDLERLVSRSSLNYPCKGLHVFQLNEFPERAITLYVCEPDNDMFLNHPDNPVEKMTVAFHSHTTDITIHCVEGTILNRVVQESNEGFECTKFLYELMPSGANVFTNQGTVKFTESCQTIGAGQFVFMTGQQIHTVACNYGELAAWIVYDGKCNPDYKSYLYGVTNPVDKGYLNPIQRPDKSKVISILKSAKIISNEYDYHI